MNYLGLVSILVCWMGLLFLIKKWPGNASMTFSQHAARHKISIWYYRAMWSLIMPAFYWFMIYPFSEKLGLSMGFKIPTTLASISMLMAAWIPELPGWRFKVHRFFAFSMATLLLPILIILLFSVNISGLAKIVSVLSVIFMVWSILFVWFETAIKHKVQEHPYMLPLQVSYVAVFHLSILLAYYL